MVPGRGKCTPTQSCMIGHLPRVARSAQMRFFIYARLGLSLPLGRPTRDVDPPRTIHVHGYSTVLRPIRMPTNYDRGTPLSAGTICILCLKAKPYCSGQTVSHCAVADPTLQQYCILIQIQTVRSTCARTRTRARAIRDPRWRQGRFFREGRWSLLLLLLL